MTIRQSSATVTSTPAEGWPLLDVRRMPDARADQPGIYAYFHPALRRVYVGKTAKSIRSELGLKANWHRCMRRSDGNCRELQNGRLLTAVVDGCGFAPVAARQGPQIRDGVLIPEDRRRPPEVLPEDL